MKEYMKPELEVISLVAEEAVTGDLNISGNMGLEPSPFSVE